MATTVTLDDIFQAAEAKYGSYDITLPDGREIVLEPFLRLGRKRRDALVELYEPTAKVDDEGNKVVDDDGKPVEDQKDLLEGLQNFIRIVAREGSPVEEFLELVGDRLDALVTIRDQYNEKSQVGEAKPSDD